ncbi:hypothetical protein PPTG_24051 [Phytophthora nicotianae INRA-310]|uniref:Uncharacterized protein n=1 Tax=Phytophthora nicotianae (strain INRA-310) TaxID=761204 RepID=W2PKW3_PHYN3|nr:hypothetical protein PPTG_24051 [Phytophthora nicotianae INRA-310]ETN01497.1 hypothetical protein PPTG_24051 [Phytophthora nicotianae INRA-310]
MSPQDKVCAMLQHERFRNRYHITKVAVKMLYAVNFHSRPIDHFLSSEDPSTFHQDRTVVHDDGQWGGVEPGPRFHIRQADQLHHVLHVIQDATAEWYPADVAAIFRAVHGDAVHQAVFEGLCNVVLYRVDSRDFMERALRILRPKSREYQHFYVHRVLRDAMMRTVFDSHGPGPRATEPRHTREHLPKRREPIHDRVVGDVIPSELLSHPLLGIRSR